MIPGVNIISRKASVASINKDEGSGGHSGPLSRRFEVRSSLRKFLGSEEHLDWPKIALNVVEISTVQDDRRTKNSCKWKYTYIVLKFSVK